MDSDREPVFIFDRGFADVKLMNYLDYMGAKFIIRVRKNTGIVVGGYVGKLSELGQWGYFRNVLYHKTERIGVNLFCAEDDSDEDDPVFIVSNRHYWGD